jgi:hypothetical protein
MLSKALSNPGGAVKPGDTIWLLGGTYSGLFTSTLHGTAAAPIYVRCFPGQRAVLDGGTASLFSQVLAVTGNNTWYWGLEVMSSSAQRTTNQTGSGPTDLLLPTGVYITGYDNKFINLFVHDTAGSFGFWTNPQNTASEIYGSVIYNNGWDAPDRGHGHGIYAQNQTGTKTIQDNVIFNQFGLGIQVYGSSAAYLDNFIIDGNSIFDDTLLSSNHDGYEILLGGDSLAHNPVITNNYTYQGLTGGANNIGYDAGCTNGTVENNYFGGGLMKWGCINTTVTGNTFYGSTQFAQSTYPNNTYYSSKPPGPTVFVRPNRYEPGRANITIFNWRLASTVAVDLSSTGLAVGAGFAIIDAQNPLGPALFTGTYLGSPIQVPMNNVTVAIPTGNVPHIPQHTSAEFGVFLLLPTAGGIPVPPAPAVISNIQSGNITSSGATITWSTDVNADSQVEYGPTAQYGFLTPIDLTAVQSHSMNVTGLTPNVTYHFRVRSRNDNGTAISSDNAFTTSPFVPTGPLSGYGDSLSTPVDLTAEGASDWVHWGDTSLTRKSSGGTQLSSYTIIGTGSVLTYSNDPRLVNWSDGSPTGASANNAKGVYIGGIGKGFTFTAPADTSLRTLRLHAGGWNSGGMLTAQLNDGSGASFADVTAAAVGQYDQNYTLYYSAASAGKTLTVTWTMNSGTGNVSFSAATLTGAAAPTPASVLAYGGTPQSTAVTSPFANALQAKVLDASNNPMSGVPVIFTAPGSGASGTFAGGGLTATISTDGTGVASAPAFTANGQTGGYSVTAAVTGVTGSASFSLNNTTGTPFNIQVAGGTPQSATVSTSYSLLLKATVRDAGNNLLSGVPVLFTAPGSGASGTFSGGGLTVSATTDGSGVATATAFTANGQAATFIVTAGVTGLTPASFNLTNTAAVTGGGAAGSLYGSADSMASAMDLTAEGTGDWVHWGDGSLNRKSGVSSQLSNYASVPSGSPLTYDNDLRPMSWSDGSPTASATNNRNGLYRSGIGNGFSFTAPATTAVLSLKVHVGGWNSGGTLTAHLSDNSAADFVDIAPAATGQYDRNYLLTYQAGAPGQTLTVTWKMSSGNGNVTLNAAALAGSTAGLLAGLSDALSANVDLTGEGVVDWIHWGDSSLTRKAGVGPALSGYTLTAGGTVEGYANDPRTASWTDGAPLASSTNDAKGLYLTGVGKGFSLTAPADTSVRTLKIHVGGWNSSGKLTVTLSDGSAPEYVDITPGVGGQYDRNYTLSYRANSPATLTIQWEMQSGTGNITLNAAALR